MTAPIQVVKAIVVKKGTVGGNSTVDFLLKAPDWKMYVFMLTGKLLKGIPV